MLERRGGRRRRRASWRARPLPLAELRGEPAAVRRLLLRRMAESAAGRERPLSREDCDRILALGDAGGTRELDLGEGLRAVVEYGTLRFALGPGRAAARARRSCRCPGAARFGDWEVEARLGEEGEASVSAERLGPLATVRAWRDGDRMRPPGLGGTKTLQDLFTDRKVPRALRRTLPRRRGGRRDRLGRRAWRSTSASPPRRGPGRVGLSRP